MARQGVGKLAGEVSNAQRIDAQRIDAANAAANKILAALRAAKTPEECAAISEKSAKTFARLQKVHPVRAIHIVNLAAMKKREFEEMEKRRNKKQMDLWA